ncbi:helix-turn-helix domain-containing protein [Streptomyces sp. NPDC058251]|uniref:helix-turn-helix domain-containing protein n=1 Tax=Streptomyces sp. NPDC058251 TaxID=3346404 RepID=UPI0036E58AB2
MEREERATFAAELTHWRSVRGLSKAALAQRLNIDPSYVSHLEAGREHGSSQLARRADTELDAGGALWRAWQRTDASPQAAEQNDPPSGTGLLVLEDKAALRYDDGRFHLSMRRLLHNSGTEPVTRYLVRIAVDRYPSEPKRSNALYRRNPLTWEELQLTAHCADEPMGWTVKHDRDAFKEVWLQFQNPTSRFPLYPGQEAEISYSYSVGAEKWGPWFQRAVRLPTRRLAVELAFPRDSEPSVWGTETSMSADFAPPHTPTAHGTWRAQRPLLGHPRPALARPLPPRMAPEERSRRESEQPREHPVREPGYGQRRHRSGRRPRPHPRRPSLRPARRG